MARPRKQTVDYFPHPTTHGKNMFALEQTHGNDGYAFWFKLQELLGAEEGHALRLDTPASWVYLTTKMRLSQEVCTEILNLLADLGDIDPELWRETSVIWSDSFLAEITDAYRNRTIEIPSKPGFLRKKPRSSAVSGVGNPQTIIDKTIPDETIPERESEKPASAVASAYSEDFEAFWGAYPKEKRVDKKDSYRSWKARLKDKIDPALLIGCARKYAQICKTEGKEAGFILMPTTFLNGKWERYLPTTPPAKDEVPRRVRDEYLEPPMRDEEIERRLNLNITGLESSPEGSPAYTICQANITKYEAMLEARRCVSEPATSM